MKESTLYTIKKNENIIVKDLLQSGDFKYEEYYSSELGLNRRIQYATIMDVQDIGQWLKDYEVLIIGAYARNSLSEEFIQMLIQKDVACIVTKQKFKPDISNESFELLYQYNLPIIFIDNHLSWSDVQVPIQRLIMNKQFEYLTENQNFFSTLVEYLTKQHSLSNFCNIVYELTEIPLAIATKNIHLIDYSNILEWKNKLNLISNHKSSTFTKIGKDYDNNILSGYIVYDKENAHSKYYIIPINSVKSKMAYYYIVYFESVYNTLPSGIIAKLRIIDQIYALKHTLTAEMQNSNRYFKNYMFNQLLNMSEPNHILANQISLGLGQDIKENYFLLLVKPIECSDTENSREHLINFISHLDKNDGNMVITVNTIYFEYDSYWIFLINHDIDNLYEISSAIAQRLHEFSPDTVYALGVSDEHKYWNLSNAYREAKFSLNFVMKNPNYANNKIIYYSELGINKLFSDESGKINMILVSDIYKKLYLPLIDHDNGQSTNLIETLDTFLNNNLSYKQTSETLFIHVNTLRYRIKKIETLLNVDISNIDSIVNLRLMINLKNFGYFNRLNKL